MVQLGSSLATVDRFMSSPSPRSWLINNWLGAVNKYVDLKYIYYNYGK